MATNFDMNLMVPPGSSLASASNNIFLLTQRTSQGPLHCCIEIPMVLLMNMHMLVAEDVSNTNSI
ncbi:hypothetical protein Lalb_Chr02g0143471 [Lupinus albus]|uniref:Uncharacterized protein n=1 Tax=Lupinus albus TaxID=3870 RepID=A0A6A4QZ65_LUPAL|nr:hypothetical protein Lalb_Chr02g0143471 [Lupinus albus]